MKFTVIGNPVSQSKSPQIQQHFAKQFNLADFIYTRTLAPLSDFAAVVTELIKQDFQGANVTIPFKEQAFCLANQCTERAAIAKAANTLQFLPNGTIMADNTDGIGFIKDIQINHHYALNHKKILILGAGGAVRGILYPLLTQNPHSVTIANRTLTKMQILANDFKAYGEILISPYDTLDDDYDLVIDGTSFTAWPLQFDQNSLLNCSMVYDLKYSDTFTPMLQLAHASAVAQCSDGMGMLIEQAAESFYLWTGKRPNTGAITKKILQE